MQKFITLVLITFSIIIQSCGDFQRPSKGRLFEVLVVMDSTQQQQALADSIRASFGGFIMTLPSIERRYDLTFFTIKSQKDLEFAKRARNVIFASSINDKNIVSDFILSITDAKVQEKIAADELNAIRLDDKWYSNQWILILSGSSQEKAAAYLSENQIPIIHSLDERERKRWVSDIYDKGRQVKSEDSLWTDYGWKIGIQHDYVKHIEKEDFVSFRRFMPENDRWIWVWWQDGLSDLSFLTPEWVNKKRDELLEENIRGKRPQSYLQTEYLRPVESYIKEMNGRYTIQTNGTWTMVEDLMGGPFVNFTIYDEKQNRLYMIEFAQFAPKFSKRNFVRQFEAMALTFETDSLYSLEKNKQISD
jgi:hypothetical protein